MNHYEITYSLQVPWTMELTRRCVNKERGVYSKWWEEGVKKKRNTCLWSWHCICAYKVLDRLTFAEGRVYYMRNYIVCICSQTSQGPKALQSISNILHTVCMPAEKVHGLHLCNDAIGQWKSYKVHPCSDPLSRQYNFIFSFMPTFFFLVYFTLSHVTLLSHGSHV